MNKATFFLLTSSLLLLGFHRYYVSITDISYSSEKTFQVKMTIFIDDFNEVLEYEHSKNFYLGSSEEQENSQTLIVNYINSKFGILVNDKSLTLNFVAKKYDSDKIYIYLESEPIKRVKNLSISNKIFFEVFESQQNITNLKIGALEDSAMFLKDRSTKKYNEINKN